MNEDRKAALKAARERIQIALSKQSKRVPANPPPRYDEVYAEGTAVLDSLAGKGMERCE